MHATVFVVEKVRPRVLAAMALWQACPSARVVSTGAAPPPPIDFCRYAAAAAPSADTTVTAAKITRDGSLYF